MTNTGQKFDHTCFISIPPPTANSLLPNPSDTIEPSIPVLSTTQVIPPEAKQSTLNIPRILLRNRGGLFSRNEQL